MKDNKLTQGSPFEIIPLRQKQGDGMLIKARAGRCAALMAVLVFVAGCININAPDDAIVIELNINITQEVVYRLAADAGTTIEDNADIF